MKKASSKNPTARRSAKKSDQAANLGFEAKLFLAVDKLRGNMEPSEYKHVVLGIDSDIRWNSEGSFHKDELKGLKEDARWQYGIPPPATPTSPGSSTSSTTSRQQGMRVSSSPTAPCPPPNPAKAKSARTW